HDRAFAAAPERLQRALHAQEHAGLVDPDHLREVGQAAFGNGRGQVDAGVVDQDVEAAEVVDGGGDGAVPGGRVADVVLGEGGAGPERVGQGGALFGQH